MSLDSAKGFYEIYTSFYRKSYLYVKSYVHDKMAAEDIVAESLIKLWERMKIETIDPIAPYLFTLLKNRSLDYLKHERVKEGAHQTIISSLNREREFRIMSLESCDPNEVFSVEVQHIIETTLNMLPQKTREIFVMSHFGYKSHQEIADLYDMSVKGVDYHIMNSIRELRSALKDYLPLLGSLTFLH